jgi:hypothetical protein
MAAKYGELVAEYQDLDVLVRPGSDRASRTIQLTTREVSRYISRSPIERILPASSL